MKRSKAGIFLEIARGIVLGLLVSSGIYAIAVADSGMVFRYAGY